MSQEIFQSRFDHVIFSMRRPLAAAALLFILYCVAYLWFFVPYEDFTYAWRPDSQLVVIEVPVDSLAYDQLQPGDLVLAIGGEPVRRMRPVYPLPVQQTYAYSVQRGDEIVDATVTFSTRITPLTFQLRLPATVLSLASWLVGTIILMLSKHGNAQALRAGSIFTLGSVVIIGIQGSLNGVPGTWIAGYVLSFILVPAWIYRGFIPRTTSLSFHGHRIFKFLFVTASILAVLAVFEVLYLYPQPTSFQELSGVSIFSLSLLFSGLGLVTSIVILAKRALALPRSSYLRQQLQILLMFFGLGILPTVILTFIPAAFFNLPLLPFEIAISLMLLIPIGYLFVIYRRGFLGLDLFFSRSLHLILLTLVVFGFYGAALYLVQKILNQNSAQVIVPSTLVFLPTMLLAMYMNKPLSDFVDRLVYGSVVYSQDIISDFTLALTSRPELGTLDSIVASLAGTLSSTRASLVIKDETGRLSPISVVGIDRMLETSPAELEELEQPLLRSSGSGNQSLGTLLQFFAWAEILVPLKTRDEQIGVLALSRPGRDGYFNLKQVSFLTQAAGVLAVGIENIYLFDSTRRQSRQRLVAQEEARKDLSRQLHDEPLQQVTYAVSVIDQLLVKHFKVGSDLETNVSVIKEAVSQLTVTREHLRKAAASLRNVCIGLYPPFHDQGVDLAVNEILHLFESEYGLKINYTAAVDGSGWPTSEQLTATVSRVLTESLNNVIKHAHGADVDVKLETTGEGLLLLHIADNGPGSRTADHTFSELVRQGHLGIVGMHEWAQQVGGSLEILRNEPNGTKVLLSCPV